MASLNDWGDPGVVVFHDELSHLRPLVRGKRFELLNDFRYSRQKSNLFAVEPPVTYHRLRPPRSPSRHVVALCEDGSLGEGGTSVAPLGRVSEAFTRSDF